jgi:hypothetical protein
MEKNISGSQSNPKMLKSAHLSTSFVALMFLDQWDGHVLARPMVELNTLKMDSLCWILSDTLSKLSSKT